MALMDFQVRLVWQAKLDQQVLPVLPAHKVLPVPLVHKVLPVRKVLPVLQVQMELTAPVVRSLVDQLVTVKAR
jgi:hypothetical protein